MNSNMCNDAAVEVEREKANGFTNTNSAALRQLDQSELNKLLIDWNNTTSEYPRNCCIHDLFAEQAARMPEAVAVVIDGDHLSYQKLNEYANQIAHYLRSMGVGSEAVVGLCIDRSLEMIIGILGILKAGGAYLPLDKSHPAERVARLLKDAGASVVLTSPETDASLFGYEGRTLRLDLKSAAIAAQPKSNPESNVTPENLAYVMYTSGSSGAPKGVGVMHYNISRLVRNANYVQINPTDIFLQLAPVSFDAATFEIWGALLNGARLVLYAPDPILDLMKLKSIIHHNKVSVLWLTAGLFNSIVDGDLQILSPLRQLLVGGDVVSAVHVRRLLEQIGSCRVINGYGPTEGTTFSVCFPIPDLSAIERTVPIGYPVSNTTIYVLDSNCQLVATGETGELYIGGAGLARGYFHRPDLTAERFLPNSFSKSGDRMYRTGDMVRYSNSGVLEFIGRIDSQVKVRGYRIELEEIETVLASHPGIRQAAVVTRPEPRGDKQLVAYVVGADDVEPDLSQVREYLKRTLPEYMIPSLFVPVKELPLTEHGKLDRKALRSPEKRVTHAASQSATEQAVAKIWAQALGVDEIGVNDDFFELGGTSLALINVVVEIGKRFGIPLDTSIVTRGATVAALAQGVEEKISAVKQDVAVEQAVTEIWVSALGVNEIGVNDDFFELGGTSLALINVVVEIGKRFGIPLDTSIVTRGATVAALAQGVKEKMASMKQQTVPVEETVKDILASALGVKEVGANEDFFELGGTSLGLINAVVEMGRRFGIPLDTSIVTQGATVGALAQAVRERISTLAPSQGMFAAV